MSFDQIIKGDRIPLTKELLIKDLKDLGVQKGDYLLIHSSLNQIGYVIGKVLTVIEVLIDVVGPDGLIVMPTQTTENSNPEMWHNPPVPKSWVQAIKENMPAFHPDLTPTFGMGAIPEYFRKMNGVIRSNHPQVSFASYGNRSEELLGNHPLDYSLSDDSPLGKMVEWNFKILMLGTDYETCTAMHLSEYRSHCRKDIIQECAITINGERKWVLLKDIDLDSDVFNEIGASFEKKHSISIGKVGYAESRLIDMAKLINFTTNYLSK